MENNPSTYALLSNALSSWSFYVGISLESIIISTLPSNISVLHLTILVMLNLKVLFFILLHECMLFKKNGYTSYSMTSMFIYSLIKYMLFRRTKKPSPIIRSKHDDNDPV
jgi:hypothetical protein